MKIAENNSAIQNIAKICKRMFNDIDINISVEYQPEAITGAAGYSIQKEDGSWLIGLNNKMPHTRVAETVLIELAEIVRQYRESDGHIYDDTWQEQYTNLKDNFEG